MKTVRSCIRSEGSSCWPGTTARSVQTTERGNSRRRLSSVESYRTWAVSVYKTPTLSQHNTDVPVDVVGFYLSVCPAVPQCRSKGAAKTTRQPSHDAKRPPLYTKERARDSPTNHRRRFESLVSYPCDKLSRNILIETSRVRRARGSHPQMGKTREEQQSCGKWQEGAEVADSYRETQKRPREGNTKESKDERSRQGKRS